MTAAAPYPGGFPELGPPLVHSQGVDYRFKEAYSAAKMIMEGAPTESLVRLCAFPESFPESLDLVWAAASSAV